MRMERIEWPLSLCFFGIIQTVNTVATWTPVLWLEFAPFSVKLSIIADLHPPWWLSAGPGWCGWPWSRPWREWPSWHGAPAPHSPHTQPASCHHHHHNHHHHLVTIMMSSSVHYRNHSGHYQHLLYRPFLLFLMAPKPSLNKRKWVRCGFPNVSLNLDIKAKH